MVIAESHRVAKTIKGTSKANSSTSSPAACASDRQEAPVAHVSSRGCSVEMIGILVPPQAAMKSQ